MWLAHLCLLNIMLTSVLSFESLNRNEMTLKYNGFQNILIALHDDVTEDYNLIKKIKEEFTLASEVLYNVTRQRAYFCNVDILVPRTWAIKPDYIDTYTKTYFSSNIRVFPARKNSSIPPKVITYQGCGKPGEYMNLPDEFFFTNPKDDHYEKHFGKTIVHEWAHLRWGVFDDNVDVYQGALYYSTFSDKSCPKGIDGKFMQLNPKTGTVEKCKNYDKHTIHRCVFLTQKEQPSTFKASIMGKTGFNSVYTFCDKNGDVGARHNSESPTTPQNILCNKRSTWEVIESTPDFANGNNPPRQINNKQLKPKFTVYRRKSKLCDRIVLVLDISASMKGKKWDNIQDTFKDYIKDYVEINTEVGIVVFNSKAKTISPLTKITSSLTRTKLSSKLLGIKPDKRTSIGAGLKEALKVLNNNKNAIKEGGIILLLSDGEENTDPRARDVIPEIIKHKITVHTFAYTPKADNVFEEISEKSGGVTQYQIREDETTKIYLILSRISEECSSEYYREVWKTKSKNIKAQGTLDTKDLILPYKTTNVWFLIRSKSDVSFQLTAPNGDKFDQTSKVVSSTSLKSMKKHIVKIPGKTMAGNWTLSIKNEHNDEQRIEVVASSVRNKNLSYVHFNTKIIPIMNGRKPLSQIIVEAIYGYDEPVTGLKVIAELENSNKNKTLKTLLDNGVGSDINANDGIYSALVDISGRGRQSVTLFVETMLKKKKIIIQNVGQLSPGLVIEDFNNLTEVRLKFNLQMKRAQQARSNMNSPFSTTINVGIVTPNTSRHSTGSLDKIPPSSVGNLRVKAINKTRPSVTLQWVAPGNDGWTGKANYYEISMFRIFTTSFQEIENVTLYRGDLTKPKSAMKLETFEIATNHKPGVNSVYSINITAVDRAGNKGEPRDIVVPFIYKPMQTIVFSKALPTQASPIVICFLFVSMPFLIFS